MRLLLVIYLTGNTCFRACGVVVGRPNPQSIAQACLDSMALQLPTKHTFVPLMDLCNTFLSSPEPHVRKAAVAALGVMSEGCAEPIKARLADILPKILQVRCLVSFVLCTRSGFSLP